MGLLGDLIKAASDMVTGNRRQSGRRPAATPTARSSSPEVLPGEFGPDATAGEAVFVPASPMAAEDDGYVMAFVHAPDRGAADLVILAAQDFSGDPVARIHLPARIPLGFHGSWIPDL